MDHIPIHVIRLTKVNNSGREHGTYIEEIVYDNTYKTANSVPQLDVPVLDTNILFQGEGRGRIPMS
jgi:hypothetical protein